MQNLYHITIRSETTFILRGMMLMPRSSSMTPTLYSTTPIYRAVIRQLKTQCAQYNPNDAEITLNSSFYFETDGNGLTLVGFPYKRIGHRFIFTDMVSLLIRRYYIEEEFMRNKILPYLTAMANEYALIAENFVAENESLRFITPENFSQNLQ